MTGALPWPLSLDFVAAERVLRIHFDDGAEFAIPFELLRVESPSAEVQGHGNGPRPQITGKAMVGVRAALAIGRYALRISFDDGHDTGLFSWDYLYRLGRDGEALLRAYRERNG